MDYSNCILVSPFNIWTVALFFPPTIIIFVIVIDNLPGLIQDRRIVIGFDPLVVCEEKQGTELVNFYDPLHHIFLEFGVVSWIFNLIC